MPYVDTSVLVPYYCPEANSKKAQTLLAKSRNLAISPLTSVELTSAISIKIRRKELTKTAGRSIVSIFEQHVRDEVFEILPLKSVHFTIAESWIQSFDTSLRTLDALHLAIAFEQKDTLLTADKQLAGAANQFKVRYQLVR